MSNSREQSLDENVVFLPITEASPEFLHCEKERQAVERLLSAGPEAFYSSIGTERSGCFLSSEEVSQITSWAQDYHFNPVQVQQLENGEEGSSDVRDFCSTYFPSPSDVPTPDLELGWPEKSPWVPKGTVTVFISPPAEGDPPVREVIRRHLQKASQVIAIATDRLTDGAIIGDLHNAASRGVPVYIILNQRSIQENFTLNRLRHPNMQVRVLGGKTFCSKAGRMVAGEMNEKFLLVDLETVIHGSYSLTWTDAHLHRQLITVLQGPVVDSFDREFRILFAASRPVPDTWRVAGTHEDVTHQLKDFSHHRFQKQISWDTEVISPPSPPAGSLLDWEAMGVIQRDSSVLDSPFDQHEEHEEILAIDIPLQNNMLFAKNPPVTDSFTNIGNQFVDKKRVSKNISPLTKNGPDKLTSRDPDYSQNNTQPSQTYPRPLERVKRNPDYLHSNTTPSQTDLRPPERVKRNPDYLHSNTTPSQTDLKPPERVKKDPDYLQTRHSQTDLRSPDKMKRDPDFLQNNTMPLQADLRPPERMKRNPDYLHSKTQPPQTDLMSPERMKRDPDYLHSNTQPSNMDLRPPEKAKRDPDYLNSKKQPPPTDLMSSERMKRVERNIEKAIARQLSSEQNPNPDDRKKCDDQTKEPTHNMVTPSPATRTERSRTGSILEAESSTSETSSKVENTPSSRKPLILRVPQSESFSSLSDIMKRLHLHESSPGRNKRGPKTAVSEMSRSMMDLSVTNTDSNHDEKRVPVPRFKASCFDPGHTPASSLMKNRSEDVKPLLYRTPKNFIPKGRPRSSSYALNIDWRRSLAEMSSEQE